MLRRFLSLLTFLFLLTGIISSYVVASELDDWSFQNPLPTGNVMSSVTYGNGMFMALEFSGNSVLTSVDGESWTRRKPGGVPQLNSITYGGGIFMAVGYGGMIVTSSDGENWTSHSVDSPNGFYGVAYGNGVFVAVGQIGMIMTSSDGGASWTRRSSVTTELFNGITYGNGTFVAVENTGMILTSVDGETWTSRTPVDVGELTAVTYGNGEFMAVGTAGRIVTSSDNGENWISRTSGTSEMLRGVAYGDGVFMAVGYNGLILDSVDGGASWNSRSLGSSIIFYGVAYGNGMYVAAGTGGMIVTSVDGGANWISHSSGMTINLNGVAYGSGTFVGVGAGGAILASDDSRSWTSRTSGTTSALTGVAFGNGIYVAAGAGGTIVNSDDNGASWTSGTSNTASNINGIGYGNGTFVAVGAGGTIVTSGDYGVSWAVRTSGATSILFGVAYGNGTFVAVGQSGTILTSGNGGEVWTSCTSGTTSLLRSVVYGNGIFVAVGTGGAILTSSDGVTWVTRTSGTAKQLAAVAYGNGTFVAAGTTGVIVTSGDGANWTSREQRSTNNLMGIVFGSGSFRTVGTFGTILHALAPPIAPPNPQNLAAIGGNNQVTLNWSTVTGATYYNLYMSSASGQFGNDADATVTDTTYQVHNLINGTPYYFIVRAGNPGGLSTESNEALATPATVPAAPTHISAVAGDGQATVAFTAPTDNGGSAITGYEVTAAPGNAVYFGLSSPIVVAGLSNGTSYTFTVKAINAAGSSLFSTASNSVVPASPSGGGDNGSTSSPVPSPTPEKINNGADVLVNGKLENAGTAATSKRNDQTVITISVDQKKLEERLAAEGQAAVITIPVNTKADVVIGELNGQMVKSLEDKQAILEIKTDRATYRIPAQQLNIIAISERVGKSVALQDIKVRIEIAALTTDMVTVVENAAAEGSFTLVVPPLNFKVNAIYGNSSVEVSTFNDYVERSIAIPEGVDPGKITTGVVVDPDGTVRHVPTKVVQMEGNYYAVINSLTNSTYAIVWHPLEFGDAAKHWAEQEINDMGSRMVINGTGEGLFNPDRDITRAEFAAILVRGLGLKLKGGTTPFLDVNVPDWYAGAVNTAYAYRLINGFEDGSFRPNDKITREQAMVVISNVMTITKVKDKLASKLTEETLRPFADADEVSGWAVIGIANSVEAGIVSGRNGATLAPRAYITRAEVATILERFLKKSELL